MRQTLTSRLLALLFLFPAGLAAPGIALADGAAHHRAHGERRHHAGGESPEAGTSGWATELAVSGTRDARDCERPGFYRAIRNRVTASSFALLAPPPALPVSRLVSAAATFPVRRVAPPRADLETGPPPSLRAPPLR